MPRTALVVGSEGFIGRCVVASLVDAGLNVYGFDRREANSANTLLAGSFVGSITDRDALQQAVGDTSPEVIVSLAAWSDQNAGLAVSAEANPDLAFEVNVEGHRHLLNAACNEKIPRLIWSSSTVVFGPGQPYKLAPLDEDAPLKPVNIYGLTKTMAETLALYMRRVFELDIAAVRPTLVLGPNHPYQGILDPLKRLFASTSENGPVDVTWGSHAFDIVHVGDVADAICALAVNPDRLAPAYHVNGGPITIEEIKQTVLKLRPDLQINLRNLEPPVIYPLVSAKRIELQTGFRPRFGARATIEDCVVNAITPKGEKHA